MKYKLLIIFCIALAQALFGVSLDDVGAAWKARDFFFAEISQTSISPMDTSLVNGKIVIRKPDAIFKTDAELIIYKSGKLWTFTTGSDVGTVADVEQFAISDVPALLKKLGEDFKLELSQTGGGLRLIGTDGEGNIASFEAELDSAFIPKKVVWNDIFAYRTEIFFKKTSTVDNGEKIEPPSDVEFIE